MTYFSRRNQHVVEFSGYEDVSYLLRKRLLSVLQKYVGRNPINYYDSKPWYVSIDKFIHEVRKEFPECNPTEVVEDGEFHKVFTIVEIFLNMLKDVDFNRRTEAFIEVMEAFKLSGSVYEINGGNIELVVTEDLAKKIESAKAVLSENPSAYEKFFQAVGNFVGRKSKVEDAVKDIFIAFEDYLKDKTGENEYGAAVKYLEKSGHLSSTQKSLLDKIYAYRSDTDGVVHSGNGEKPDEIDALWFLETVVAQLLFIDRKLKQDIKEE